MCLCGLPLALSSNYLNTCKTLKQNISEPRSTWGFEELQVTCLLQRVISGFLFHHKVFLLKHVVLQKSLQILWSLSYAVTAKFVVQIYLFIPSFKNFAFRSLSMWMCAIAHSPINWFSRLVSRDLQIPSWPMRLLNFPVCVFWKDTNSTTTCCSWLSCGTLMNSSRLNLMIFWTAWFA